MDICGDAPFNNGFLIRLLSFLAGIGLPAARVGL